MPEEKATSSLVEIVNVDLFSIFLNAVVMFIVACCELVIFRDELRGFIIRVLAIPLLQEIA